MTVMTAYLTISSCSNEGGCMFSFLGCCKSVTSCRCLLWSLPYASEWLPPCLLVSPLFPEGPSRDQCPQNAKYSFELRCFLKIHFVAASPKDTECPTSLVLCVCVCITAQLFPTLCDPMNKSPPDSSVHGISQARTLWWVNMHFSRGSSRPKDWTLVSGIAGSFFTMWAATEALVALQANKSQN